MYQTVQVICREEGRFSFRFSGFRFRIQESEVRVLGFRVRVESTYVGQQNLGMAEGATARNLGGCNGYALKI